MPKIDTTKLVKALLSPGAYPHRPPAVELAQTQMSLVFLTGSLVYKVKKPVNLGYLDYTTLEKRLFFCQQEVALNRRLCPQVYLGVVPIVRKGSGLVVEGQGEAVEYAVKMQQLPRGRMMDVLLGQNQVTEEMVRLVASRMANFHREAETSPAISAFGSLDAIRTNTDENFSQAEKYVGQAISPQEYEAIKDYTNQFIQEKAALFKRRVQGGRIRDCHGDLHAAHICFSEIPLTGSNGLCIYDCIEFNDRFRYCDVASEIAFLAMDLDFHGRPPSGRGPSADLSRAFSQSYMELSGDKEMGQLLDFYKGYRAYVRGKVECFKAEAPLVSAEERERAWQRARAYFKLACSYIPAPGSDRRGRRKGLHLFITVGLVGTGKTALAEALAERLGLAVISSDVVRKSLAGIPIMERHYDEFNKGLYSAEFTRRTYDDLLQEADRLLAQGKSVILDASFRRAEERQRAQQLAQARGVSCWLIEVTCPEEIVRQRLEERRRQANVSSDGRWEVYLAQKQDFDPVEPSPQHILVDSSQDLTRVVEQVIQQISSRDPLAAPRRRR